MAGPASQGLQTCAQWARRVATPSGKVGQRSIGAERVRPPFHSPHTMVLMKVRGRALPQTEALATGLANAIEDPRELRIRFAFVVPARQSAGVSPLDRLQ